MKYSPVFGGASPSVPSGKARGEPSIITIFTNPPAACSGRKVKRRAGRLPLELILRVAGSGVAGLGAPGNCVPMLVTQQRPPPFIK